MNAVRWDSEILSCFVSPKFSESAQPPLFPYLRQTHCKNQTHGWFPPSTVSASYPFDTVTQSLGCVALSRLFTALSPHLSLACAPNSFFLHALLLAPPPPPTFMQQPPRPQHSPSGVPRVALPCAHVPLLAQQHVTTDIFPPVGSFSANPAISAFYCWTCNPLWDFGHVFR